MGGAVEGPSTLSTTTETRIPASNMADHHHHHHHQHRPHRISVPPHIPSSRLYPHPSYNFAFSSPSVIPFSPSSSSAPTPSKQRRRPSSSSSSSLSSLFLLLFSLRSLYSLLPFLRSSSPSFSLFPFSFLVSLLSFFISLLISSSSSYLDSPLQHHYPSFFSLLSSSSLLRPLAAKSSLLALVFVLRYQALRSCGASATILAEFAGTLAAKFISDNRTPSDRRAASTIRGVSALLVSLLLLSLRWDRIGCFPSSSSDCIRVLPMLLPFLSGFLAFFERASANWATFRQFGRKRVRLIALFFTSVILFFPALVSFFSAAGGDRSGVSVGNLGWPLVNNVVFGVILSENYGDDKVVVQTRNMQKDFLITFVCTLVLELFYLEELSLFCFLLCGILLWFSVWELDSKSSSYPEIGSDSSHTFSSMFLSPIRHILSERKSRKIALFLLINTAYMVVEFVVGFMSNSLGLISDACHMLFDCAALAIGLYASYISRLPANNQFSYGRGRFEVLSGYVNAVFLVLVGALIVLESIERILDPQEISTGSLLTVSIGGLVVNVVGLIFFHEEHHHAHGGSCSHSHDHGDHHTKHQHKCMTVSHEASYGTSGGIHDHNSYNHEKAKPSSSHHDHCHHNHHHKDHAARPLENLIAYSHSHDVDSHDQSDTQHGLQTHACQHDSHDHSIHGPQHNQHGHHVHGRDNHMDNHQHGHGSQDHHNHGDQRDSQGHCHQSDCHDNQCHGHQQHHHHSNSSRQHGSNNHGHKDQDIEIHFHSNEGSCCNIYNPKSSHFSNHAIKSDSCRDSAEEKVQAHPQKHRHIDHNMEGIFLHVLADTMGSVGVVISTLLIKYKGWLVADPASSIFISALIVSSVLPLLRNSAEILLQRVPRAHEQDLKDALDDVMRIKGVHSIQNMHVWSLTNTDVVGTLHLHISKEIDKVSTKEKVLHILHDGGIKDMMLQVE